MVSALRANGEMVQMVEWCNGDANRVRLMVNINLPRREAFILFSFIFRVDKITSFCPSIYNFRR